MTPIRCLCCPRPFATIQDGRLVIQSKHGSATHVNALTVEDLERLVAVLRASRDHQPLALVA